MKLGRVLVVITLCTVITWNWGLLSVLADGENWQHPLSAQPANQERVFLQTDELNIRGYLYYADRATPAAFKSAVSVKVELWDKDTNSSDDRLAEATYTDSDGFYSFPPIENWDEDEQDPYLQTRLLDIYVLYSLENEPYRYQVTNLDGIVYSYQGQTQNNISPGIYTYSGVIDLGFQTLDAMWIYQDIRNARNFYILNTNPHSEPGELTAHWEYGVNEEYSISGSHFWALGPHVFIAHNSTNSSDTVIHELAHQIMWNKTSQWGWNYTDCWIHSVFSQESPECAWLEGWANFFAITVNNDPCYDLLYPISCYGTIDYHYYNLENHTRNDLNQAGSWWGDGVEGRVAGALYDLMDTNNESPYYDTANWDFDTIADTALGNVNQDFFEFWLNYPGYDRHHGVRSIYQNTIDYDHAPVLSTIPDHYILQNEPAMRIVDLWQYASDYESLASWLTYTLENVDDPRCGITIHDGIVYANPQYDWSGSCYVWVRVSDTIPGKFDETGFWVNVLPADHRRYLPIVAR